MRVTIREFRDLLAQNPDLKRGCVVDTNALFAATMPLDRLNGWAEKVFPTLHDEGVPIYSNLNIRSEFIELNRRVLVPEGLVSYYDASLDIEMDKELRTQLKLLKTAKDKATDADTLYKFNEQQLKKFRSLMMGLGEPAAGRAWLSSLACLRRSPTKTRAASRLTIASRNGKLQASRRRRSVVCRSIDGTTRTAIPKATNNKASA